MLYDKEIAQFFSKITEILDTISILKKDSSNEKNVIHFVNTLKELLKLADLLRLMQLQILNNQAWKVILKTCSGFVIKLIRFKDIDYQIIMNKYFKENANKIENALNDLKQVPRDQLFKKNLDHDKLFYFYPTFEYVIQFGKFSKLIKKKSVGNKLVVNEKDLEFNPEIEYEIFFSKNNSETINKRTENYSYVMLPNLEIYQFRFPSEMASEEKIKCLKLLNIDTDKMIFVSSDEINNHAEIIFKNKVPYISYFLLNAILTLNTLPKYLLTQLLNKCFTSQKEIDEKTHLLAVGEADKPFTSKSNYPKTFLRLLIQEPAILLKTSAQKKVFSFLESVFEGAEFSQHIWTSLMFSMITKDIIKNVMFDCAFKDYFIHTFLLQDKDDSVLESFFYSYFWPLVIFGPGFLLFAYKFGKSFFESNELKPSEQLRISEYENKFLNHWHWLLSTTYLYDTYPFLVVTSVTIIPAFLRKLLFPTEIIHQIELHKKILENLSEDSNNDLKYNIFQAFIKQLEKSKGINRLLCLFILMKLSNTADFDSNTSVFNKILATHANAILASYANDANKGSILSRLYANKLLIQTGSNAANKPSFIVASHIIFYTLNFFAIYPFFTFFYGFANEIDKYFLRNKRESDCPDGWKFAFNQELNEMICSLCGDLPIYPDQINTTQGCINGYLLSNRTAAEIVNLFQDPRYHLSALTSIHLDKQENLEIDGLGKIFDSIKGDLSNLNEIILEPFDRMEILRSQYDAKALGDFFSRNHVIQLKSLNIKLNHFTNNGFNFIFPQLPNTTINLNLASTSMKSEVVPELIFALKRLNLSELILDDNSFLESNDWYQIVGSLSGSRLKDISLSNEKNFNDGVLNYFSMILNSTSLEKIDISDNRFNVTANTQFLNACLHHPKLKEFIFNNDLDKDSMLALIDILPQSSFEKLKLSIDDSVESDVLNSFFENAFKLHFLEISQAGIFYGKLPMEALCRLLKSNSFAHFALNGFNLTDNINTFTDCLSQSPLNSLEIISCIIPAKGIQNLFNNMRTMQLKSLIIHSDEGLDYESYSILEQTITPASSLQKIQFASDLYRNTDVWHDVYPLFKLLSHSKINELILMGSLKYTPDNNVVTYDDHLAFIPGSSLEKLSLMGFKLSDSFIKSLHDIFIEKQCRIENSLSSLDPIIEKSHILSRPTTNLTYLNLFYNNITDEGAQMLCADLPYTYLSTKNIDLSYNNLRTFDPASCRRISSPDVVSSASSLTPTLPFGDLLSSKGLFAKNHVRPENRNMIFISNLLLLFIFIQAIYHLLKRCFMYDEPPITTEQNKLRRI